MQARLRFSPPLWRACLIDSSNAAEERTDFKKNIFGVLSHAAIGAQLSATLCERSTWNVATLTEI